MKRGARREAEERGERFAEERLAAFRGGAEQTIQDLFTLRALLEVHAIELACARIGAEEIAYLKQIRAQAIELLKSTDTSQDFRFKRFIELSSMFHDTIYNATRSRVLIKVISK